eukprot:s1003_g14.t1
MPAQRRDGHLRPRHAPQSSQDQPRLRNTAARSPERRYDAANIDGKWQLKPNARDTLIEKENQLLVKRIMTVKSVFDPNGKDLEEFRTHQRRVQVMQEPGELTVIRLSEIFWEFRRLQEFRGSACARPPPPPVPEPKPSKPRVAASLSDTNLRHLSALLCPWDLPAKRSTAQPQPQADTTQADAHPAELATSPQPWPLGDATAEESPSGASPERTQTPLQSVAAPLPFTSQAAPHQAQTQPATATEPRSHTASPSPTQPALPSGSASQEAQASNTDRIAGPASITASPPQTQAAPAPAPGTLSSDRHADPFGDLDLFGNRGTGIVPAAAAPAATNETPQSRPVDPFGDLGHFGDRAGTDARTIEPTVSPADQEEPGLTNATTAQPDRHADPFGELDIFGNSDAKPAEGGGRPRRRRVIMTILPSIMSTSHLAQGHVYHTSSMPPRSRTLSPKGLPRHPSLELSTRSRTRTEWLEAHHAKSSGEIRNIHVLGIINGNLVVSFQGSGRVRVFVNNEHSLELPETNRLGSTSPFGVDWTKKYSKYVINSRGLRFAEFVLKALPAQILVVGETASSDEKLIPAAKPIMEVGAKILLIPRRILIRRLQGLVTFLRSFDRKLAAASSTEAFQHKQSQASSTMLDASSFGVVCVKVRTANDLKLIMDALTPELILTQDLIINDKVLDEGKQLGLLGKEMVESRLQLEQLISEGYTLDHGRYEPVIDLSFLNMSSMKDSCSQIRTQMQKQEEDKRKQDQAKLQAELDEEDTREDQQLLQEAGDLSYKVPAREWDGQFAQDSSPQKVASGLKLEAKVTEQRITRYMTAEPDDKGVVKVYIDDPDVANASKESIHVSFSMSTYTVRVGTSPCLVLGPVDCGVIDQEASSWRLSKFLCMQ